MNVEVGFASFCKTQGVEFGTLTSLKKNRATTFNKIDLSTKGGANF